MKTAKKNVFNIAVILIAFLIVFLGVLGFKEQMISEGHEVDYLGLIYAIAAMFALEGNHPYSGNWMIGVAQLLALVIVSYVFFVLLYKRVTTEITLWRVQKIFKNHYVLIGTNALGRNLAKEILESGEK